MMKFELITSFMPLLVSGTKNTLIIWILAACISMFMGIIMGVLRSRMVRIPLISNLIDAISFVLRGVPFYVQLLVAYFVLPELIQISLSPMMAGTISLGLCSSAYMSQMVKGGINSLADEQWEAAFVLGLSKSQALIHVILPQALRNIAPMICGELDMLLKSTSIISAIGVLELTRAGLNIIASEMQIVLVYGLLAFLYLLMSSLLNLWFGYIERRYA